MAETCTVVRFSKDSLVRIDNLKQNDSSDKLSEMQRTFGIFYMICISLSIITYIADLVLACILLYFYSVKGYGLYFTLTLTFLLLPALIMNAVSMRWYIVDHDDPSLGKTSVAQWIVRILFLLLQLAPLLRYLDTFIYGLRSLIAKSSGSDNLHSTLYRRMLDEDSNGALLRLFHCFLHSAPQAIIQLMFLINYATNPSTLHDLGIDVAVLQSWTVLSSLLSIAWALTSYHRSVRFARDDKETLSSIAVLIGFCWHLMSAVARILALSLLASIFPTWMGIICALHWGVMSIWLALSQHQTAACSNRCEELLFSAALGLAYVIAFISPRDGPTRYIYLAYYLVCFMENIGALVVWCVANNSEDNPLLYYGAAGAQLTAFLLAILFLLIYYRYCHPSTCTKILEITDIGSVDHDKPGYSKTYTHVSQSHNLSSS
ncbi:XK-related protein 4-like [Photinus pyralis]|uniref:XK-related protein 4-like n=1 Tax=Photinus pyralis TaxID=7054 RepID=UPI0012675B63|nr:XK-related protein 4-like [Photinus pyralis]